ncbi:hypothetical protein PYCH_18810 [Pyrococcus yayanosii CH1]|uniref:Uncharacterized protein n=1 Tax=Pyrococcus yayanosii (strain CH1 / JCM 16557) TaxID=529709 RepID=F8AID3_PYRYC|nr:hypothetical protein PYCH_18810 [Pyrococcus yayanosii CH1]
MKVLASMRSSKRIHVKPDIMIFRGEYYSRRDILKNPPNRAVLIDAKVEITQNDLKQLLEYTSGRHSKEYPRITDMNLNRVIE